MLVFLSSYKHVCSILFYQCVIGECNTGVLVLIQGHHIMYELEMATNKKLIVSGFQWKDGVMHIDTTSECHISDEVVIMWTFLFTCEVKITNYLFI